MRRFSGRIVAYVLLGVLGISTGCDKDPFFLKAEHVAVSADGKYLTFGLGGMGLYRLDIDPCELTRLTVDRNIRSWVDQGEQGFLITRFKDGLTQSYLLDKKGQDQTHLPSLLSTTPLWISDEIFFWAAIEAVGGESVAYSFYLWKHSGIVPETIKIAEILVDDTLQYISLPAIGGNRIYYSVVETDAADEAADDQPEEKETIFTVTVFTVDVETRINERVAQFTVPIGERFEDAESAYPAGNVQLAISPDQRTLLVSLAPEKVFPLDGSLPQSPTLVYLIDAKTGERKLMSDDIVVASPQWVPKFSAEESASEEVAYEPGFLYLSDSDIEDHRSLWIADSSGPVEKLADLPGRSGGFTQWVWLSRDHLRIIHTGEGKLMVIDRMADGLTTVRSIGEEQIVSLLARANLASLIEQTEDRKKQTARDLSIPQFENLVENLNQSFDDQIELLQQRLDEMNREPAVWTVETADEENAMEPERE